MYNMDTVIPIEIINQKTPHVKKYNANFEMNLDNNIIYKSISKLDLDHIPLEDRFPPPLTKRLNIELENNILENNILENNILEDNLLENNLLENNLLENNLLEDNLLEDKLLEYNLLENNLL